MDKIIDIQIPTQPGCNHMNITLEDGEGNKYVRAIHLTTDITDRVNEKDEDELIERLRSVTKTLPTGRVNREELKTELLKQKERR